jgi:hypothetical protein
MKQLIIIPFVFLAACASRPPKKITIIDNTRTDATPALRSTEQVREYRFGRYTDPRDPLVMHESHPVYRVEETARWNLRPSAGTTAPRRTATSIAANDAVVAEVNKQRAATRALVEQASTLNQKLGELSQAASQSQEIAKQNLALKADVSALRSRLDVVEARDRVKQPDAPAPAKLNAEDKW